MNQSTSHRGIITGIIILLLLIFGAFWAMSKFAAPQSAPSMATEASSTNTDTTPGAEGDTMKNPVPEKSSALHTALVNAGNTQCDYDATTPSGTLKNTLYISGGKMRAEFRTRDVKGVSTISFYDGTYLYTWPEGKTAGTRAPASTLADIKSLLPFDISSAAIFGGSADNVSWNCHTWLVDKSKMVLPSYVTYK